MALPTITTPRYTLELPSTGKQITFRPFLVREEKILLMALESDDTMEAVKATKQVIENCCEGLDDIDNVPMFDIEYILLQLRSKSVGELAEPVIKCPDCDGDIKLKIDLSKVGIIKDKTHTTKIPITDTIGLVMKYPTYSLLQDAKGAADLTTTETMDLMLSCIDYIYDGEQSYKASEQTTKELNEFVDQMTQAHFAKIQEFFGTMPRLEHTVAYTCTNKVRTGDTTSKKCGYKGKLVLGNLQDFFA